LLIALDHDGTYTLDPAFWLGFIADARAHGHAVHIVTLRHAEHDRLRDEKLLIDRGCQVIYCDGRPKIEVAKERGYRYDIWIEDDPAAVHRGSPLTPAGLATWREKDEHRG